MSDVFLHPNLTAAQADAISRDLGLRYSRTEHGNFVLSGPPRPLHFTASSRAGVDEDGAGPYPEAA